MTTRRQLLATALAAASPPAWLRSAHAAMPASPFTLGIASGSPRPDGMVLWTRLTGPALPPFVEVAWEVALDERFARVVARGREIALAPDAHSVHAEPAGLAPGRPYWYRFSALGHRSPTGLTRTAPAPGAPAGPLELAVASCQRWDHGHYAAWARLAEQPPGIVLFLGDYIYENAAPARPSTGSRQHRGGTPRTLADYRDRYALYKSDPALQAAHAAAPWLLAWDDHEVDNDYAGLQDMALHSDFPARRAAAYQAYWEHQPLPRAARPGRHGLRLHDRCDWGGLARIHLLDGRQYRDPQACPLPGRGGSRTLPVADCPDLARPERSLLGAAQERWLADGWSTTHGWNLLAQQTLMAGIDWRDAARPDQPMAWTDGWDGYAPSRARLLGQIAERRLGNVVVLGGDVHAHVVADLRADRGALTSPVLASEFCGTSISSQGLPQARLDRALPDNPHLHWARSDRRGMIRLRLDDRRLEAALLGVVDVADPASPVETLARFVVEAGRPGVQRA